MITTLSFVQTLNTIANAKTRDLVKTYKACQTALELELYPRSTLAETRLSMSLIEDALLERGHAHLLGCCTGCGARLDHSGPAAYCTELCEAIADDATDVSAVIEARALLSSDWYLDELAA